MQFPFDPKQFGKSQLPSSKKFVLVLYANGKRINGGKVLSFAIGSDKETLIENYRPRFTYLQNGDREREREQDRDN